jgi:hypothetical protein
VIDRRNENSPGAFVFFEPPKEHFPVQEIPQMVTEEVPIVNSGKMSSLSFSDEFDDDKNILSYREGTGVSKMEFFGDES